VVVAAVVALVVALRADSKAQTAPAAADRPTATTAERPPPQARSERPRLPPPPPGARADRPPRLADHADVPTYVRDDGVEVRDHRRGRPPPDLTRAIPRPTAAGRKVETQTVVAVRNAMRPVVNRCAAGLPAEGRGDRPEVHSDIIVSITDNQLHVDQATVRTRDITGDQALVDCIREGVEALNVAAEGHAPVDRYTLSMPFRLR
jgi:hypothetical protein